LKSHQRYEMSQDGKETLLQQQCSHVADYTHRHARKTQVMDLYRY